MGIKVDIEKRLKEKSVEIEILGKIIVYTSKPGGDTKLAYIFEEAELPLSGAKGINDTTLQRLKELVLASTTDSAAGGCCKSMEDHSCDG